MNRGHMSRGQRRPYRVVFSRPGPAGANRRRGTIVAASIEIARHEAQQIAISGGTAEVHYVTDLVAGLLRSELVEGHLVDAGRILARPVVALNLSWSK